MRGGISDPGANMPDTLSGAILRPNIARSHLLGIRQD